MIPSRTGLGCWRTHLQCPEESVVKVEKEGLSAKQVGSVNVNPVTAYRLLTDFADLKRFSRAWYIQNGANSGVGRIVSQLGKLWGLRGIAVVRAREDKEAEKNLKKEMLDLGAEKCVTDTEMQDKSFKDVVAEWTNGGKEPVQLGLNCVGGEGALAIAKILGKGASLVTYGAMARSPLKVPASMLIFKDLRLRGFWVSAWGDQHPEEKKKTVQEILGLCREGKLEDSPSVDVEWKWDTPEETLVDAVQGTLEGYRKGKGMFVFKET